jgi:hypothetical protein
MIGYFRKIIPERKTILKKMRESWILKLILMLGKANHLNGEGKIKLNNTYII